MPMQYFELLDRYGVSVFVMVVLLVAIWTVIKWFAPRVDRAFEKHFALVDTLSDKLAKNGDAASVAVAAATTAAAAAATANNVAVAAATTAAAAAATANNVAVTAATNAAAANSAAVASAAANAKAIDSLAAKLQEIHEGMTGMCRHA